MSEDPSFFPPPGGHAIRTEPATKPDAHDVLRMWLKFDEVHGNRIVMNFEYLQALMATRDILERMDR